MLRELLGELAQPELLGELAQPEEREEEALVAPASLPLVSYVQLSRSADCGADRANAPAWQLPGSCSATGSWVEAL